MSNRVLLIDNDTQSAEFLQKYMLSEGFDVKHVDDGDIGLKLALNQPFDAIILDIMLPNLSGFEIVHSIREHQQETAILMLTGRRDEIDRVLGLETGADDYMVKPCNPLEVITRLKAILRRVEKVPLHKPIIQLGHIVIDSAQRTVTANTENVELTNTEFNILEILMKSPGQAFSKEELTEYALGRKFTAFDRSIDVHISNLRNKLGSNASGDECIKTVRGFGYMIDLVS